MSAAGLTPGRTIVFSHANGFPAGTYRVLFEQWRQCGYRVIAVDRFGHDPTYPVTSNWPHLRDQLLDLVRREARGEAVHLVGHSLGGYLSLLAACRRPEIARSVVLMDSPVVAGWRAQGVRMAKLTGLIRRVSPGRVSQTRRWHWPSAEAAQAHFRAKSIFARWDPRVLGDYLRCGLAPDETLGGVRLAFEREVETRIYNTLPHHFGSLLARHPPRCAVCFIGGRRSVEVRRAGMQMTRALARERLTWIDGGHLFPMEHPEAAAQAVIQALQTAHRGRP